MPTHRQSTGLPTQSDLRYSLLASETGTKVWMSGDEYRILLDGVRSGNAMTLIDALVPPSAGPPEHAHADVDELFFLLDGELEFTLDGDRRLLKTGEGVFVRRTVPHAFRNCSERSARMLLFYTPSGAEDFFLAAGRPAIDGQAPPAVDEENRTREIQVASAHGISQAERSPTRPTDHTNGRSR